MQLKSFEVNTTAVNTCKFMGFEKGKKCFVDDEILRYLKKKQLCENNFLHILPVQKPLI